MCTDFCLFYISEGIQYVHFGVHISTMWECSNVQHDRTPITVHNMKRYILYLYTNPPMWTIFLCVWFVQCCYDDIKSAAAVAACDYFSSPHFQKASSILSIRCAICRKYRIFYHKSGSKLFFFSLFRKFTTHHRANSINMSSVWTKGEKKMAHTLN